MKRVPYMYVLVKSTEKYFANNSISIVGLLSSAVPKHLDTYAIDFSSQSINCDSISEQAN